MQESELNAIQNNYFKPSELLNIFKNFLSNKEINASVICLRGIYIKTNNVYSQVSYDKLKDENSSDEITIVVPNSLRNELKNGNLISVYGTLDRNVRNTGSIQILLQVSRFDKIKDLAITEEEIKRADIRRIKESNGYKNVDTILENILFTGNRPKIALLFAETSITDSDFNAGIVAAKSHIDFKEYRVSFANSHALADLLEQLDHGQFDAITLLRGGGSGLEKLDDLPVIFMLSQMRTPCIYGAGHEDEKLFVRNIVDKVIPIPHAVGTYFRDMVDSVSDKRNRSKAVLVEEVRKQFREQLETGKKQNKELQERLEALTKTQNESVKKYNEQLITANKQNTTLQEQLAAIQKNHKEQIEKLNESQSKLQTQLKNQLEDANKRTIEMNKNISDFQKSNNELQKNLNQVSSQNSEYLKQLGLAKEHTKELENQLSQMGKGESTIWEYAEIIAITLLFLVLFLK